MVRPLGCLVAIILIGLPFAACTVREQIRRAEAIRKTWAAARMLGATEKELLGSYDDCGERGAWCAWVSVFTTRESSHDFEDKIKLLSTQPIKQIKIDSALSVVLMRLDDAARYDGATQVNGFTHREVIGAEVKGKVRDFEFFRWPSVPDDAQNGVSIDFFGLRELSDKYTFKGAALNDNVFVVACIYRFS